MKTVEYPRIAQLGINITFEPCPHINSKHLIIVLKKHKIAEKFYKYYGIQTAYTEGPYPWDVEAVLERIFGNCLTGSQLIWD